MYNATAYSLDGRHTQPRIIEVRSQSLSKTQGKTQNKAKRILRENSTETEHEKCQKRDNIQWNSLDRTAVEQHSLAIKYNA